MSYRDDHAAALARADAAVREAALLAAENDTLRADLARARDWLGGPRKRAMLLAAAVVLAVGNGAAGVAIGRATATCDSAPIAPPARPAYPEVHGMVFAEGPEVGRWMMKATRCTPRDIGMELTSLGGDDMSVGIIGNDVEIETPNGALTLEAKHCQRREVLVRKSARDDQAWGGFLELDCRFRGNQVHGYIEFENCRR